MLPHAFITLRVRAYTEGMTTNTNTITVLAEAMTGHPTSDLLAIVAQLKNSTTVEERMVKFAAFEVIEARNPDVVPMLEAWCSDDNDDRDYADMLADAIATLPAVK
jgi:quinol monooxygenase YgiN